MTQAAYKTDQARQLRLSQTHSEERLWQELRNRKLGGYKFRRQRPIDRYIADFCCDEIKLVVEVYGSVHETLDQREYDDYRQEYFEANGYTIMICQVNDVMNSLPGVSEKILNVANSLKTPSPLYWRGAGVRVFVCPSTVIVCGVTVMLWIFQAPLI
jgi:very-short-patch-repair endonuclease